MIFIPTSVCSRQIEFEIVDNKLENVVFIGGCKGNLKGICNLIKGMDIDEVISKLQGIQCMNGTSCPDQLTKALIQYKSQVQNEK